MLAEAADEMGRRRNAEGTIYPCADKQKYVIPESLGLARIMWRSSAIGAGRGAGTVENARPGARQKIFCLAPRILSASIHENVTTAFQPRANGQKATESVTEGRAGMTRGRNVEDKKL
jgi:hypothetical protein